MTPARRIVCFITLAHCCSADLDGDAIGRQHDLPPKYDGNDFAFDAATRRVLHGWTAIDG